MKTDPPYLSLVIPAYNEEDRIGTSLRSVSKLIDSFPHPVEVLVVEDGSTDRTAEIVQYYIEEFQPDSTLSLIRCPQNRGKGFAVKEGFKRTSGRYVVFSDTDLSAPIDQIPKLLQPLERGADVAIASRRLPDSEVVGLPLIRRTTGRLFAWLSRVVVLTGYTDTQCGFKAYRAEAAKELADRQTILGYTFDVEHLLWARHLGMKVVEVPVKWIYTEGSKINGIRDSFRMFRDLLALRRRFSRLTRERG